MTTPDAGSSSSRGRVSRRTVLQAAAGLGLAAVLPSRAAAGDARDPDRIRRENDRPGTRDWMLRKTGVDPATRYRCPWIEGYCSRTSVRPGETIHFIVSTSPPARYTLDFYRMGGFVLTKK